MAAAIISWIKAALEVKWEPITNLSIKYLVCPADKHVLQESSDITGSSLLIYPQKIGKYQRFPQLQHESNK